MSDDQVQIATQPRCYRFGTKEGEKGIEQLERRLRAQNETGTVPINTPNDVLLNTQGLVQQQYRFTTVGLTQLCSALAPGLAQAVGNIAGLRRKETEEDEGQVYDPLTAIKLLNAVIRMRFESSLKGQELIIDKGNKRVEGIVGPRYQFFSNLELLERCQEFADSLDPSATFYHASLAGRRLLLRFMNPQRLFALPTSTGKQEPFYTGWHFSNSEIGDCSVHASMALIRKWTRTVSLFETGRVVHVKGNFGPKFLHLLEQLQLKATAEMDEHSLSEHAQRLCNTPLQLGGDPVAHAKRLKSLVGKLSRGKVPRQTAKKAVHRAIAYGSYKADKIDINGAPYDMLNSTLEQVIRDRTVFDLYNSTTLLAATLLPEQQETAERLAYRIYTDRYKLS